jgi:parallel beta-helix repeat protein
LWFDQSNVDVDVANNQILDNEGSGIYFEISDDLLLVNNYIRARPAGQPIKLAGSSGLKLVNNTFVGGGDPIGIYTDIRSIPGCSDPAQPVCANSFGSDRDTVRPRPATLDWMPRLDLMINNIVAYPARIQFCQLTTVCIGSTNGPAVAPVETIIHQADASRGIPRTFINANVYANGTGKIVHTAIGSYSTIPTFVSAMATSPVSIPGFEVNGQYGNSWVNTDGSPTSALAGIHGQAAAVPTDVNINQYIPAGTKHYGVTYK